LRTKMLVVLGTMWSTCSSASVKLLDRILLMKKHGSFRSFQIATEMTKSWNLSLSLHIHVIFQS